MTGLRVDGLDGRVALVTGAGGGIGTAVVETLLAQGARVVAADLAEPAIEGAFPLAMDVADETAVDRGFTAVERELGPVGVLVLNAGVFVIEPFEELSLASWQRTIDINPTGAYLCARRALPGMREAGWGRVVAIGSSAGKTGGSRRWPPTRRRRPA